MKRFFSIAACLAVCISLCSCSLSKDTPPDTSSSQNTTSSESKQEFSLTWLTEKSAETVGATDNIIGVKDAYLELDTNGTVLGLCYTIWAYDKTVASDDYWIEGTIVMNSRKDIFFNKTNEKTLISSGNPIKNKTMLPLQDFTDTQNSIGLEAIIKTYRVGNPTRYEVVYNDELYRTYIASADSKARYVYVNGTDMQEISKPSEITPDSLDMEGKRYFIIVPNYAAVDIDSNDVVFEHEGLVTANLIVVIIDK